jgi:hypothetical protein
MSLYVWSTTLRTRTPHDYNFLAMPPARPFISSARNTPTANVCRDVSVTQRRRSTKPCVSRSQIRGRFLPNWNFARAATIRAGRGGPSRLETCEDRNRTTSTLIRMPQRLPSDPLSEGPGSFNGCSLFCIEASSRVDRARHKLLHRSNFPVMSGLQDVLL